jgi:hypothetical protein
VTPFQSIGRSVTLLLLPSGSTVPLGPAWAVLCGAWAAVRWQWNTGALLALIVTIFIAEVLWSSWRAHVIDMDWSSYLADHPLPEKGEPLSTLPYTTPWSPLGRTLKRWSQIHRWMRESLPPRRRGALLAVPILPPLILLLAALIGRQMLLLSVAALALILVEWRVARRAYRHTALQAGLEIGLSWLAGHIVFAPLTAISFALACCYAVAYQGALDAASTQSGENRRAWSLALLFGGQAAAAIVVLSRGNPATPLAATAMGLLLAPQLLLLAHPQTQRAASWYLRRAAPFFMLAMPVAAWTI